MIKIEFLDGNTKDYASGITLDVIASEISKSLRKKVIAGYVDNMLYDLKTPIEKDAKVRLIEANSEEGVEILNHSCAHLMAHAISRLYPGSKFGVGPTIENGFYYDVETTTPILEADLKMIEKEMARIVSSAYDLKRIVTTKEEALVMFKDDEYKTEIIRDIADDTITLYQQDNFTDLCRGPHVDNTKVLKYFKLLSLAGAYWKGDSNNVMLQRVYGVCKASNEDLDHYLYVLEEAKKRDHRKLGKELDLFMMSEYGPGMPFFLPNGLIVYDELVNYWKQVHSRENYLMIKTPVMLNKELWETSGHWFNYRENMYVSEIDKHEFAIKPMNCPGGMLVYANSIHSYRDFPLRMGELGLVHRHEASGALHGLFRVRTFTQDDAHIFMREDQIESEIINLIKLYEEIYSVFELDFNIELSTKPENAIGTDEIWSVSEGALKSAMDHGGYDYVVNPGDGAFYGPKLDFKLKDSLGRIWQCGTIQLDLNLPERFDLLYTDQDGSRKRPVMLHRACLGSLERFMGIVIEHYAGALPTWLAPVQVKLIAVNDVHKEYVNKLNIKLKECNIRTSIDDRDEKLGYKIRESQMKKVPYTLVIGDKEVNDSTLTYRKYGKEEQINIENDKFIDIILYDIKMKGKI